MKTTRRRFLQGAAALAATLGLTPTITASPAHVPGPDPVDPIDAQTTPSGDEWGSSSVSMSGSISASPSHGPWEACEDDG